MSVEIPMKCLLKMQCFGRDTCIFILVLAIKLKDSEKPVFGHFGMLFLLYKLIK